MAPPRLPESARHPIYAMTARSREPKGQMTAPLATTDVSAAGLVEKTPLERYVPPAKPSLVGLSRAELAEALASIGVPVAQRKMRVQQIWHLLYVRGAEDFSAMTSVSKELDRKSVV